MSLPLNEERKLKSFAMDQTNQSVNVSKSDSGGMYIADQYPVANALNKILENRFLVGS
jgi:hypothetical protein